MKTSSSSCLNFCYFSIIELFFVQTHCHDNKKKNEVCGILYFSFVIVLQESIG